MIDLYTWSTPNGRKASIMLEELGLPYRVHPINITEGEQFEPEFLKISPNNRIPAIVDSDGPGGEPISVFESGAILIYLAEKTGRFMPTDARLRIEVLEWVMWQMGNLGPMLGQAHHFLRFAKEDLPYAKERYAKEAERLYRVLDNRLEGREYIVGEAYTVADIICYPWIARHEWQGRDLNEHPNVKRWFEALSARPAVQRGMAVPAT